MLNDGAFGKQVTASAKISFIATNSDRRATDDGNSRVAVFSPIFLSLFDVCSKLVVNTKSDAVQPRGTHH